MFECAARENMAAGGLSFNKGSDMIHDYSCSKCEENDLNAEAQHFCPQCEHYLCDKCVKIHGGYFKKHVVYGRGDIQKWAGFSIDICAEHGKERDVVCGDHYLFCCSVCVALNHRHYQVRIKNDKKTCLIDGICELPSGEMVLADRSNKRVKLLNKQFEVIDHSDMPGNPQHLCHITGNEVAVVVCDCISNEVHFLTVTKEKLQSMRKFTTDHNCVFIAHHQGQLYVGSMDGLYLYTMAGRLLKKIYEDLS
ncbi:hypothetical protein MAR_027233, partial [Mya arenaria]